MIDLSVGNPEIWNDWWPTLHVSAQGCHYPTTEDRVVYSKLCEAIQNLHRLIGNIEKPEDYQVVIGAGASQVVQAALAAFNAGKEAFVYAKAPHFPRFKQFTEYSGKRQLTFTSDLATTQRRQTIEIITFPNNPDNEIKNCGADGTFKIYDCSYLWPQYTNASIPVRTPSVAIFSLAKALGLAGVRIGWALVHKHAYAEKMRKFIELQGGGVSSIAQEAALLTINEELERIRLKEQTCFSYGKEILDRRWAEAREVLKDSSSKLMNTSGMFLWIKYEPGAHMLDAITGVKSAHGPGFGVDDTYARINLACDDQSYNILLDGLRRLRVT